MKQRLIPLLLIALQLAGGGKVFAEKADSEKAYSVIADKMIDDDVKQIRTWSGDVILTQGTLTLKGAKLVTVTSPDGYMFATLYAPAGGLATMRQKRDGGPDLWMEGEGADRITYDQKTSVANLYLNAKVRRLTGTKTTDEAQGAFISYNSQTEIVTGANDVSGTSKPGKDRVIFTSQSKDHPPPKDK